MMRQRTYITRKKNVLRFNFLPTTSLLQPVDSSTQMSDDKERKKEKIITHLGVLVLSFEVVARAALVGEDKADLAALNTITLDQGNEKELRLKAYFLACAALVVFEEDFVSLDFDLVVFAGALRAMVGDKQDTNDKIKRGRVSSSTVTKWIKINE